MNFKTFFFALSCLGAGSLFGMEDIRELIAALHELPTSEELENAEFDPESAHDFDLGIALALNHVAEQDDARAIIHAHIQAHPNDEPLRWRMSALRIMNAQWSLTKKAMKGALLIGLVAGGLQSLKAKLNINL